MEMKYDVFISYSSKDQKVAEGICGYLERYGLRCFVAYRDIPKGKVWAEAIADGIDDSAMMVVVFSQNFNRSKQVDREIELAAEDNKPILTYRITDDPLQGAKKYYLKNLNWIDAFPNPQENFGKLYTNVCQLLGKKPLTTVNNQPQPKPQPKSQPKSLLWLWILLGVLVFGGVVFGVKKRFKDKTFTVNGVSFEMVAVKGGTFTMGASSGDSYADDDERPTHSVTLGDYYMGKFEVTQELWEAVMGSNPSRFKGNKLPVETVSWYDAVEFCNRLSEETGRRPYYSIDKKKKDPNNKGEYDDLKWTVRVNPDADGFRLPTEAEWEYAARAGSEESLYGNENIVVNGENNSPNLDRYGWYGGNCGQHYTASEGCDESKGYDISGWEANQYGDERGGTHPVGRKTPNAWGIYDMLGNVWEWCQDWYGDYGSSSQTNPQGPSSGSDRVLRGGSWIDYAGSCRVSYRGGDAPDDWLIYFGLRLVLVP